jgi:hypothetical protein
MTAKNTGTSLNNTEAALKDLGDLVKNLDTPLKQMQTALKGFKAALEEPGGKSITVVYKPPDKGGEILINEKKATICNPAYNPFIGE